jgi:uncharacterized protein YlxP (DUF503 family)
VWRIRLHLSKSFPPCLVARLIDRISARIDHQTRAAQVVAQQVKHLIAAGALHPQGNAHTRRVVVELPYLSARHIRRWRHGLRDRGCPGARGRVQGCVGRSPGPGGGQRLRKCPRNGGCVGIQWCSGSGQGPGWAQYLRGCFGSGQRFRRRPRFRRRDRLRACHRRGKGLGPGRCADRRSRGQCLCHRQGGGECHREGARRQRRPRRGRLQRCLGRNESGSFRGRIVHIRDEHLQVISNIHRHPIRCKLLDPQSTWGFHLAVAIVHVIQVNTHPAGGDDVDKCVSFRVITIVNPEINGNHYYISHQHPSLDKRSCPSKIETMTTGILTLHILLPACNSLKEKRSRIKPVLARLHREFNVSTAEVDRQDMWQEAVIAVALVSNDSAYTQKALQQVLSFFESHFPDLPVLSQHIEIL